MVGKGTIVFLAANASYAHTNLAGWYLREYAARAGWTWHEVEVIQNDSPAAALQSVLRLQPDVLAASFYLFNAHFLLSFLARFKALSKNCLVIGGGPEFLGDNFSFLDRYREINAVIRGAGEQAFAAWLASWNNPDQWRGIRGLCAFIDGNYVDNGKAELITNLDEIPSPYEYNLMNRNIRVAMRQLTDTKKEGCHSRPPAVAYAPALRAGGSGNPEQNKYLDSHFHGNDKNGLEERRLEINLSAFKKPFLLLETSRGCSNRCAFCTSAGESVRFFSPARVRRDLALISAAGVKTVRVADRTFNEKPERCLALIRMMRDEFSHMAFHLEIDPARLTDAMMQELGAAAPGQFHLEIGVQTLCAATLRSIGRAGSVESALANLRSLCSRRNIAVHVDLIAGLPGAGLADLYADLRTIALMQPDEIQLELLKVLPGTRLSVEKEKFAIIAANDPPYEVLRTAAMSHDDLVAARRLSSLVDWFYNTPELRQVLVAAVELVPDYFARFVEFGDKAFGAAQAPALENRFRLLEQFCRRNAPALVYKLAYAWLKCGLSAQHGLCPVAPWKKPLPAGAALVEGDGSARPRRVFLAELERPYLFVYGQYPQRQASAVYVLPGDRNS